MSEKLTLCSDALHPDFEKMGGLVPVIVQDALNDQVLMLAYMNEQAYEKTLETGLGTYWSRSRNQLWCKGETSGHFQQVVSIAIDCDEDTLLMKVIQQGAACHTGNRSCFYRMLAQSGACSEQGDADRAE